jgi:hypothetical protein
MRILKLTVLVFKKSTPLIVIIRNNSTKYVQCQYPRTRKITVQRVQEDYDYIDKGMRYKQAASSIDGVGGNAKLSIVDICGWIAESQFVS